MPVPQPTETSGHSNGGEQAASSHSALVSHIKYIDPRASGHFPVCLPRKVPVSQGSRTTLRNMFAWVHPSLRFEQHLDRFSCIYMARGCDKRTDRQTGRPHHSVCSNRPHVCSVFIPGIFLRGEGSGVTSHRQPRQCRGPRGPKR